MFKMIELCNTIKKNKKKKKKKKKKQLRNLSVYIYKAFEMRQNVAIIRDKMLFLSEMLISFMNMLI